MGRLLLLLASSMLAVAFVSTVALAEARTDGKSAQRGDGVVSLPDSVENAPVEAPLVVQPAEGEFQGQQVVGRSDCFARSDNPHISKHYLQRTGLRRMRAEGHTICSSPKSSILTKSTLRRWRYYGWSVALDKDRTYNTGRAAAHTAVNRNCNTLPTITTWYKISWYKIFSYHRAIYNGKVAVARTGNQSNRKITC